MSFDLWVELSTPLPRFDDLVRSYLVRQPGHDVSDEPRDESGRWTEGGGGDGGTEKPSEGGIHQPTDKERDAMDFYQGDGFEKMNHALRAGGEPSERAKTIDGLIAHYALNQEVTVYRGGGHTIFQKIEADWKEKKSSNFVDKAFVSTSWKQSVAERFSKDLLIFDLPKGQNVFDVAAAHMGHEAEQELLLPRGMQWEVTSFKRTAGGRRIVRIRPAQ